MAEYDHLFKLLLIGDADVGKSDLLLRLAADFNDTFITTIGVDFKIRSIELDGKVIKLQMWDTAGQERFRTITSSYYRGAHGLILVFSIYNRVSFQNMTTWLKEAETFCPDDTKRIIIGHHYRQEEEEEIEQREREVTEEEAREFCQENGVEYFEVDGTEVKAREKEEDLDGLLFDFTKTIYEAQTGFICGKGVKSAHHQKSANQGEERKGKEEENEGQRDGESEESKRERFKKFLRNKMGKEE